LDKSSERRKSCTFSWGCVQNETKMDYILERRYGGPHAHRAWRSEAQAAQHELCTRRRVACVCGVCVDGPGGKTRGAVRGPSLGPSPTRVKSDRLAARTLSDSGRVSLSAHMLGCRWEPSGGVRRHTLLTQRRGLRRSGSGPSAMYRKHTATACRKPQAHLLPRDRVQL